MVSSVVDLATSSMPLSGVNSNNYFIPISIADIDTSSLPVSIVIAIPYKTDSDDRRWLLDRGLPISTIDDVADRDRAITPEVNRDWGFISLPFVC